MRSHRRSPGQPAHLVDACAVIACVVLTGCAPATVTRRSAFVPPPVPPDFGVKTVPVRRFELSGAANPLYLGVMPNYTPRIGDAGLYVPNTQYQAALRYGFAEWFDLGVIFQFAPWASKEASASGVPPLPNGGDLFGAGLAARFSGRIGERMRLGFAMEFVSRWIPYAVWQCPTCRNDYSYSNATYTLVEQGREKFLDYSMALTFGWELGAFLPYISLAAASTIRNVGFDPSRSIGSTLESGSPMPILAAGLEVWFDRFRLRGSAFYNAVSDPVRYFPLGFSLSAGYVF